MLEKKRSHNESRKSGEDAGGVLDGSIRADAPPDFSGKGWEWYEARYHYNLIENGVIDVLRSQFNDQVTGKSVLDIGSGSGHWIGFYLHCLRARQVTGIDTSPFCVKDLEATYGASAAVEIQHADFSHPNLEVGKLFEVINVIGVMPTLADEQWTNTLSNLIRHLDEGGIGIVSGEFGPYERRAGKRRKYRSLEQWKHGLKRLGGQFLTVFRFNWFDRAGHEGSRDNLLVFQKTRK